jgi:hypothetical protein
MNSNIRNRRNRGSSGGYRDCDHPALMPSLYSPALEDARDFSAGSVRSHNLAQLQQHAYTVADVLALVHIGRTSLYQELTSGRLKSFVLCGRRLVLREDLLAWLRAARDAA